jgi:carbon storage regulator
VLVVSRKVGERVLIGDKVAVTIVKISGGAVRLGVEAPPEMAVMRQELAEEIENEESERLALDAPDR